MEPLLLPMFVFAYGLSVEGRVPNLLPEICHEIPFVKLVGPDAACKSWEYVTHRSKALLRS